jgi:hypothetical protein
LVKDEKDNMWPFDKILVARVKEQDKTIESLIGKNEILERELERAQTEKAIYLEKIFNITGVNKVINTEQTKPVRTPITIGNRQVPWGKIRENLEIQAREEYWNNKKSKDTKKDATDIDILEKDVLEEAGDRKENRKEKA